MSRRLIEGDELSARNEQDDDDENHNDSNEEEDEEHVPPAAPARRSRRKHGARRRGHGEERAARAPRAAAAAAAAAAPANNDSDEEPSLLDQLMSRINDFLANEDTSPEESSIDEEQARRLLEASAGDVDVACSLFWDDYFATIASRQEQERSRRREEEQDDSPRRVRQRLEEAADDNNEGDDDNSDMEVDGEEQDEGQQDDDDDAAEEEDDDQNDDDDEEDEAAPRRADNNQESVSVSDDETGPRALLRPVRARLARQLPRVFGRDDAAAAALPPGQPVRHISDTVQVAPQVDGQESHDPNEDYLSDNDWIFTDNARPSAGTIPTSVLWGKPPKPSTTNEDGDDEDAPNNVEDDEDADDTTKIPRTWVPAGFTASNCFAGLIAAPPPDEDIALFRWRQARNTRSIAPPPYHCRGVTALLSVVTALMYSGVSIQGEEANCNAARAPFYQLDEKEKEAEFPTRLADALASLLLVAAKASTERKKRALKKRHAPPPLPTAAEKMRHQNICRRLGLLPTCRWEDDTGTGNASIGEGQRVQLATSFTNLQDIRAYVLSTLRSFTKKGGCALFLETIIRIHGASYIEKMLQRSGQDGKKLVQCVCNQRYKALQQQQSGNNAAAAAADAPAPKPLDHSCISIELISLLLTGQVHSNFQGWTTGSLGIGILSSKPGEVDPRLMNPEKPVWILKGDTACTVVHFDGNREMTCAKLNQPGSVFRLSHWHPWFGERQKSSMRIVTARGEWSPPAITKHAAVKKKSSTVVESILADRRRRDEASRVVSSDEQQQQEDVVDPEEMDLVKVHPDDEKYYPNQHRQWRFDMNGDGNWTPHFRLNERQRLVVEMKLSPMINRILWTKWPGATIDKLTPEDPPQV